MLSETASSTEHRDEIFGLLSNHRRRYALHYCRQTGRPVGFSDLAEQVAAWEQGKVVDQLGSDERKRVYVSLQQTHIPAMEEAGIVDYDGETVTLTERAETLSVYMDVVPENSIPWGHYYLGLSVVAAGLLAAVAVGTDAALFPGLAYAGLVVAVFAASSLVHAVRSRRMRLGSPGQPPDIRGSR